MMRIHLPIIWALLFSAMFASAAPPDGHRPVARRTGPKGADASESQTTRPAATQPSEKHCDEATGPGSRSFQSHHGEIKQIRPDELRARQRVRPFLPFNVLNGGGTSQAAHVSNAKEAMARGWEVREGEFLSIAPPIDWRAFVGRDRSMNYRLHCLHPIVPLIGALSFEQDASIRDAALAFTLDWIAKNPLPASPRRMGGETFAWYDMAVGLRVNRLAALLDIVCRSDGVSDETIQTLWDSLIDHFRYLENNRLIAFHSNHGLYQSAGQLAAARRFNWQPDILAAQHQAEQRLRGFVDRQFTKEGVHREHSPGYQIAVMRLFSSLHADGLTSSIKDFDARLLSIQDATAWMLQPNGYLANFGDTDHKSVGLETLEQYGWNSESLRFVVTGGRQGKAPSARVRGFPASGFVAMRSDWPKAPLEPESASYLAMQCAFHSLMHKHADDLSIIWFDRGHTILTDSGRYGYQGRTKPNSELWRLGYAYSDPHRIYIETTRAHNTIEIDARDHPRANSWAYGSALKSWGESENLQYAVGQVRYSDDVDHRRLIVTRPHAWLIVVDDIDDRRGRSHDVRQWFQMGPAVSAMGRNGTSEEFQLGDGERLWATPLESDVTLMEPVRGQTEPVMQGWWSPSERVMEPIWSFHWRRRGAHVRLASLFAFGDRQPAAIKRNVVPVDDVITYEWAIGESRETLRVDLREMPPKITHTRAPTTAASQPTVGTVGTPSANPD